MRTLREEKYRNIFFVVGWVRAARVPLCYSQCTDVQPQRASVRVFLACLKNLEKKKTGKKGGDAVWSNVVYLMLCYVLYF